MTREGLLVKAPSPSNKRTVIGSLTETGSAKAAQVHQTPNSESGRLLQRIPEGERAGVQRALALLHQALQGETAGEPSLVKLEGCCCD